MKNNYRIAYLPDDVDCFFYLNESNLRQFVTRDHFDSGCIKVEFVKDLPHFTYSCLSSRHKSSITDDEIGVNVVYAQLLGLEEEDEVLISRENAMPLTSVNVTVEEVMHYELVIKNKVLLENTIMDKVKIVALGQTIPIQIFSNVNVLLRIESLEPDLPYGQLQICTELIIKDPSEFCEAANGSGSPKMESSKNVIDFTKPHIQKHHIAEMSLNDVGFIYFWSKLIGLLLSLYKLFIKQQNYPINEDDNNLREMFAIKSKPIYRVNTALAVENEFPKCLRDKCVITKRLPLSRTVDGECCFKIMCKLKRIDDNPKYSTFNRRFDHFTFAYVVYMGDTEDELNNDVYCPEFILNILNLRIGSYMEIEEVKMNAALIDMNRCNSLVKVARNGINSDMFADGMKDIYESTINTVLNNIRFNQKINTLIVGGMGTGKSYTLHSIMLYFEINYILCKKIDCKKMRKMKIPNLIKLLNEILCECCQFQPSVLLIDDLDSLQITNEEENRYKSLYSERIGNLLCYILSSYQKLNDISLVATISSLSKFNCMSTDRGPIIFENICEFAELDSTDRSQILKRLLSQRSPKTRDSVIEYVSGKTKGYNIQDLADLVEIAVFKFVSRNKSEDYELEEVDFDSALKEKIPLSLYGVNISKNSLKTWNDVGGLEEPKKLLKEMFEWPLKYEDIYKSCPLRLQCGVLLYGPPGTGKTLIASAVANECGLNFISVNGPEIFSKYAGASEQGIRDLFLRARKAKPCLLFFDEFDSLAPRRGNSNDDVNDRVVNQILTELDGVEELTGVFVLAATSRPDLLDPALLRPGRIDKAIHCDLPNEEERLSILQALSGHLSFLDDVSLEEVASLTEGYTGADLQAVLYGAQTALVKEMRKECNIESNCVFKLKRNHLLAGLAETKCSITKEDKFKYRTIHENFIASRMGGVSQRSQEVLQKTNSVKNTLDDKAMFNSSTLS